MAELEESSNDASNMMKSEYFYSEDSNLASGNPSTTKFFETSSDYRFDTADEASSTDPTLDANFKESNGNSPKNCYCGKERNLEVVELQCVKCLQWFHEECITAKLGKLVQFMTCYTFVCKLCSPDHIESFNKRPSNFSQICQTAIANLIRKFSNENRIAFSKDKEIIPFIEAHWDILSTMPRRQKNTWHNTVLKTMLKDSETFMSDNRDFDDILFALRNRDLLKIAPHYENIKFLGNNLNRNDNSNGNGNSAIAGASSTVFRSSRGVKKKLNQDGNGDYSHANKRQKSELSQPKLPLNGFPAEFPYNKDGFRYILAEPDPSGPFRKEFEDSHEYAGKPIPGWLCRKLMPEKVLLSMHDRAPQLKISDDRKTVTGEKGYCMVRASNGVSRGIWYYEIKIVDMPDKGATRIGWSQELSNLQAPLGYDKLGYSWRSLKGTKFHDSRGKHFAVEGFGVGDVLGCLIELPDNIPTKLLDVDTSLNDTDQTGEYQSFLVKTYKDKPLIKFKSFLYFEEKDEPANAIKELVPLEGAKIVFYKNGNKIGTAFENIYKGTYYPAAGLYKSLSLNFNFGPDFDYPPTDPEYGSKYRGMHEIIYDSQIEQALADMIYLVENEENLKLETFYQTA